MPHPTILMQMSFTEITGNFVSTSTAVKSSLLCLKCLTHKSDKAVETQDSLVSKRCVQVSFQAVGSPRSTTKNKLLMSTMQMCLILILSEIT